MNEVIPEQAKPKATTARTVLWLDAVLHAARKDEEKLRRIIELRRMKRRLRLKSTSAR